MWEQRYNALKPNRSEGNTRYYDNLQLRRLLNIVSLMDSGYKVSELCVMSDRKLFTLLEEQQGEFTSYQIDDFYFTLFIAAGMSYDYQHFKNICSHCLFRFNFKNSYIH